MFSSNLFIFTNSFLLPFSSLLLSSPFLSSYLHAGRLKELRRRVDIEPEVSIVRDIKGGEVRIYTDYGRIMRYVIPSIAQHMCHHLNSSTITVMLYHSNLTSLFCTHTRPLFIVGDDQKLTIKKSHIYKIRNSRGNVSGEYGWHDVLYEVSERTYGHV